MFFFGFVFFVFFFFFFFQGADGDGVAKGGVTKDEVCIYRGITLVGSL